MYTRVLVGNVFSNHYVHNETAVFEFHFVVIYFLPVTFACIWV